MRIARRALAVLVVILIAARLALPYVIRAKANDALAGMEGYQGRVAKVSLALWRGGVGLLGIEIRDAKDQTRVSVPRLDVSIAWAPLLRRMLVADVALSRPRVKMVAPKPAKAVKKGKQAAVAAKETAEAKTGQPLPDLLAGLMPFRVDRLAIRDGSISAQTQGEPGVELKVSDVQFMLENLTNVQGDGGLFAVGAASATIMDSGRLVLNLDVDPTAKQPAFDMKAAVKGVDLAALNPVLRRQWGIDVNRGTFEMYCEARARDGGFQGYVKPFIEGLKVMGGGKDKKPGKAIKEAVVGAVAAVLKNKKTKTIATKVPFSGSFDNPRVGTWQAVLTVLRNAFIKALKPGIEPLKK